MNPYPVMLEVLRLRLEGKDAAAALECSPCVGAECKSCGGQGTVPLSSLGNDGPYWKTEAEMVVAGNQMLGLMDPVIRRTVMPLVHANRLLCDTDRGPRRFAAAREAVARCAADDWKDLMMRWIDAMEKQT